MLETGEQSLTEYRIVRPDGSVAWVRDAGVLLRDAAGEPLCTQGYLLDITERKEREAELQQSEAIVDSSFDAIIGRTTDGIVTSWNAAAERIFGYSAEEMIGRSIAVLTVPGSSGEVDENNQSLRRGDVVKPFEAVRVRKDGRRIHVESTASPIVDAAGDIIGLSSITRDISERKRSQALAVAQAQLLEFIATGAALPRVLHRLVRFVEEHAEDGLLASILLLDRDGSHLLHGAAPSLPESYREAIDGCCHRAEGGVLRHRRLPPRARLRLGHRRATRSGTTTASWLWTPVSRACWSTPIFATDGARARHVRALLPRAPRPRRRRRRAGRARDAPGRHRDRARARRGSGAGERGALPGPVRERQRADRDRHDGALDPRGQPGVRGGARLHARRADRHQPARLPDAGLRRRLGARTRARARR